MKSKFSIKKLQEKYKEIPIQAKLALWITICTLVQKGISVITVPIFTRMMDTVSYGKVSAYFSWLNVLSIIASFRLGAGVYNKGLSKYKDDQEGYCLAMQYTTSIITIFLFLIYIIGHKWINAFTDMNTTITCLMFLQVFFSTSMGFWSVRQQYLFKYKQVACAALVYAILNPILGLIFVFNTPYENRDVARIASIVLAEIIIGLFFYILNIKDGNGKLKKEYGIFAIKFNLPLIPHYFSEYILNQSDRIMIQKLCSYSSVAFYSVAYNAGMLMTILTSSINQAITPWLYQSLDKKEFEKIGKVLMALSVAILIPMLIFIALAPEAVLILAGREYSSAAYVIPPVAGSVVFLFLYTNFANVEFYYDCNNFTMYISMIGAFLNIVLNFIFIKLFGYIAAGYTTFVCYFVYCAGHYLFMEHIIWRKFKKHLIDWKKLFGLFSIMVILMVGMSLLYNSMAIRYGVILVIVCCVILKRQVIIKSFNEFLQMREKKTNEN